MCDVILESVIYTHDLMNLTIRAEKHKHVSMTMYRPNGLWKFFEGYGIASLEWATPKTALSRAKFTLHLERRSNYYFTNYIFPCFLLSLLQTLTFFIPLKHPERLTHSTSVLLALIVFQASIMIDLYPTFVISICSL